MKIGIFGGTFDPCHCGHYEIVRTVLKENLVDKVIVVPTVVDYYRKDKKPLFAYDERFKILNKWFENIDNVIVDDIEYELKKKYVIESLTCEYEMPVLNRRYWHMFCDLKRKYGTENEYYSILGEDSWNNLDSWYNSEQLMNESGFIVFKRNEATTKTHQVKDVSFIPFDGKFTRISASGIRETLVKNKVWRNDYNVKPDDFLSMYLEDVDDYLTTDKTHAGIKEEPDIELEETKTKIKNFAVFLSEKTKEDKTEGKDRLFGYSELEYESLRDEAWNMAHTLRDIEKEVKDCALCDGREDCGYSAKELLKELCYIFTRDTGYHRMDKYKNDSKTTN